MSSLALYRKYRPQTFSSVFGQEHVKVTLANELVSGTVSHAYLFTGPRGVGKTTIARLLAKAVNCTERAEGSAESCGTCKACVEITEGRAMDVVEIDAASNTGVDNVRENIIENIRFAPSILKYKVFIIDEVHMLSQSAFNALLKTLEEPPAHAMFILATTELHKVPQTIVSRCQRFDFKRVTIADLIQCLTEIAEKEQREVAPSVLRSIARASGGALRDAESLLGQVFAVTTGSVSEEEASLVIPRSDVRLALRFSNAALSCDAREALRAVQTVLDESIDPVRFLDECIELLRRVMISMIEKNNAVLAEEYDESLVKEVTVFSSTISLQKITNAIELLLKKRQAMKEADAGMLPLELAAVELSLLADQEVTQTSADIRTPAAPVRSSIVIQQTPIQKEAPPVVQKVVEQPAPQSVVEEVSAKKEEPLVPLTGTANTTLAQVKTQWQAFIRAVGEINHALPFILNVSTPLRVEGRYIVLGSRYPFHCERLNVEKHYRILIQAAEQVFHEQIGVRAEISNDLPEDVDTPGDVMPLSEPIQNDPALNTVLNALGGRVM